jgi:hypothetical protein
MVVFGTWWRTPCLGTAIILPGDGILNVSTTSGNDEKEYFVDVVSLSAISDSLQSMTHAAFLDSQQESLVSCRLHQLLVSSLEILPC